MSLHSWSRGLLGIVILTAVAATAWGNSPPDCNANGVPDPQDIAGGTSADCNANGVPDSCDLLPQPLLGTELLPGEAQANLNRGLRMGGDGHRVVVADADVYVYTRSGDAWTRETVPPPGGGSPISPESVAMDGDVLVASRWSMACAGGGSNCGKAYVYRYDGVSWVEEAELVASNAAPNLHFGAQVAVSGDDIAVFARSGSSNAFGRVYMFHFDGTGWQETQILTPTVEPGDSKQWQFMDLDGDVLIVASWFSWYVEVFHRTGATWTLETTLNKSADSVAVSGNTLFIGDKYAACGLLPCGAVDVLQREIVSGAWSWAYQVTLRASDADAPDHYGATLALVGDTALVGAETEACPDGVFCGAAYALRYDGSEWHEVAKYVSPDRHEDDQFGLSIAVADGAAAVASPFEDCAAGADCGNVYSFRIPSLDLDSNGSPDECLPIDCNTNGLADGDELAAGSAADCNSNGVPDDCDVVAGALDACLYTSPFDCNSNGIPDDADIAQGTSADCNANAIPDECELTPRLLQELTAAEGEQFAGNLFGYSISIKGNRMAIGERLGNESTSAPDKGVVHVFDRIDGAWVRTARLTRPAGGANHFGLSVAIDGDLLLVGADEYYCAEGFPGGIVYAYHDAGGAWTLIQTLTPSCFEGYEGHSYGQTLALEGDWMAIGCSECKISWDIYPWGSVYFYRYEDGAWVYQRGMWGYELTTGLGVSLASDSERIVAGSSGMVYILRFDGVREYSPQWEDFNGRWSRAVAIDGDVLAAGQPGASAIGAVRIFRHVGGAWALSQVLESPDQASGTNFGDSLAMDGDTLIVGAPTERDAQGNAIGALYVYSDDGTEWTLRTHLTLDDVETGMRFGDNVALDRGIVVAAAPNKDCTGGADCGAAYVYIAGGDLDGDGILNECEVPGDCDGDGDVDAIDQANYDECLAGPDTAVVSRTSGGCGCLYTFDVDADGDVDLMDFATIQTVAGE